MTLGATSRVGGGDVGSPAWAAGGKRRAFAATCNLRPATYSRQPPSSAADWKRRVLGFVPHPSLRSQLLGVAAKTAASVCCAVVAGTTTAGTAGRRTATATSRATATTTTASGWPERLLAVVRKPSRDTRPHRARAAGANRQDPGALVGDWLEGPTTNARRWPDLFLIRL